MGLHIENNIVTGYTRDGNETEIVIPEGIKVIGESAFKFMTFITDVVFPESLTEIGGDAFYGCSGIRNLNLPYGLKTINEYAFAETKLKYITIPDSVDYIHYVAFGYSPNDPESVTIKGRNVQIRIKGISLLSYTTNILSFIGSTLAEKEHFILNKRSSEWYHIYFAVFIALEYDSIAGWKYIEENKKDAVKCLINNGNVNTVIMILEKFSFSADDIDELIQYANNNKKYEIQIILSHYRQNNFSSDFDKYFI